MAISAAGIGSNLDVNGLVSQLMSIERQPANRLQSRIIGINADLSEYGKLKSEVSRLQSAARGLGSEAAFDRFATTLSNSDAGSAAVGSGAAAGQYALRVVSLARAQTLVSPNSMDGGATRISDANAAIAGAATLTINQGGGSFQVSLAGASLNGIRDAINTASDNTGVTASVINDGSGFRLALRSTNTGAANAVSSIAVSGSAGYDFLGFTAGTAYADSATRMGESVAAADARLVVDGVTVTSSTNVFSDAIQGVTFVARSVTASEFSLSVTRDDKAVAEKVQSFVDAYNALMQGSEKRYAKGGALAAEGTLLTMMSGLSGTVGQSGGGAGNALSYLYEIGVSVDRDGRMSLNTETLRSALSSQPEAVRSLLADADNGIFKRFDAITSSYLGSSGLIDSRESGLRDNIRSMEEQITQMQKRLESVETRYRREFSSLDALMARLNQTSAALSRTL